MKVHYLYKTTCSVTGKFYIGIHSTNNIEDGYLGSGNLLKRSVAKHGAEKHVREILEFLPCRDTLKDREREIVNEGLLSNPLCMNLKLGGEGGWDHQNSNMDIQLVKAAKGRERMAWLLKNDPEWAAKRREQLKESGRKAILVAYAQGKVRHDTFTGRKHTPESLERMRRPKNGGSSNSQFGMVWVYSLSEKHSQRVPATDLDGWIARGWTKGRKMKFD